MNPRDVHPLCHLWPQSERPSWEIASPEDRLLLRRRARNKRKAWRQKRRGRK